ncbi:MAG: NTP transferase domain-containing protein [Bacteroidales bacterium]|jgi:NDP-sugar pyrophosphorylase family protein|nr:NTP transferase domain-containing protein [Bacteroidales bacterium]MCI2122352.1 NTP transferase domain-containing protein [Bacteroidales bacterium]MCI2146090.1 NTP transferase domain-containing protein [Bacteroidales bacterium]
MKAMIFAAGLGTRLRPLTDTMPKALVPYRGTPMLGLLLGKLKDAGFHDVVINVFHFPDQIIDYVQNNDCFGMDVSFSDETGLLRDTGGGLRLAAPLLNDGEPVLCHNVDIISNLDIRNFYAEACGLMNDGKGNILSVPLAGIRETARYLLFDKEMYLIGWENIKTGEFKAQGGKHFDPMLEVRPLAFSGIQVVSPKIFAAMADFPEKFSIMDFYLSETASGKIRGIEKDDLELADIGTVEHLGKI